MCGPAGRSMQSYAADPFGLLTNKSTAKFADPLGMTKNKIGDPAGQFKKMYRDNDKIVAGNKAIDDYNAQLKAGRAKAYIPAASLYDNTPSQALGAGTNGGNTTLGGS